MPTVLTEGQYPGDWLKWEEDGLYSRQEITLLGTNAAINAVGESLASGTVLGLVAGKYVPHNPDGGDGSQTAAGILLLKVTQTTLNADIQAVAIVRDAVVISEGLTWSADTDLDEAAAVASLKLLGILVREGA
jgi:hypothetical protein